MKTKQHLINELKQNKKNKKKTKSKEKLLENDDMKM